MPHKSGTNASPNPRRALFAIYNKAAEGDFHKRYYDNERQVSACGRAGRGVD